MSPDRHHRLALKALSPAELMALEGIVSKLESSAKAEARLERTIPKGSRRPFRRPHLRGEVAASDEVEAVEAVAAPDEVVTDAPTEGGRGSPSPRSQ